MMKSYPYSRQKILNTDIKAVTKVLKSDFLTQGPEVIKFEKNFSKFVNVKYSIAVNSATSALYLACMALNFKKNDILWTVANTFVSSSNCALHLGGKIDFVDINFENGNIDTDRLEQKLIIAKKKRILPKIIIPVHFGGLPTDQKKIWELSKKYSFKIIEDASHSLGSKYENRLIGDCKWSDITVFSLHPVKIITTAEGGIATTNDKKIYEKIQMLKNHGITKNKKNFVIKSKINEKWYYEQHYLGMNFRMNEISAALGISQLKNVKKFVKLRNIIAKFYNKKLKSKYLFLPHVPEKYFSSFHLYVIKINHPKYRLLRKKLFDILRKKFFFVQVHYIPVHLQPYYRKRFKFKNIELINSIRHADSSISLPIYPGLNNRILLKIVQIIQNFLKKY